MIRKIPSSRSNSRESINRKKGEKEKKDRGKDDEDEKEERKEVPNLENMAAAVLLRAMEAAKMN